MIRTLETACNNKREFDIMVIIIYLKIRNIAIKVLNL